MNSKEIKNEYFEWLFGMVCDGRYSGSVTFRKLLTKLYNTRFILCMKADKNRLMDGIALRERFSVSLGFEPEYLSESLRSPCSVLEMILALAIRCEETIMDDPEKGDRTGQWFWGMINNLGLGGFSDNNYDDKKVSKIIETFLHRKYDHHGKGGLFTIRGCHYDLTTVDIWRQLCWYLDTIS